MSACQESEEIVSVIAIFKMITLITTNARKEWLIDARTGDMLLSPKFVVVVVVRTVCLLLNIICLLLKFRL